MDFWFWFSVAPTVFVGVCVSGWWAYRGGQFARAWRWLRVLSLGGVTTLEEDLENYDVCRFCLRRMEAGDKVRMLSCDHVFHRGGISKCEDGIDNWLRTAPRMICPNCRQTPRSVLPWKAPPGVLRMKPIPELSPPQSSSGSSGSEIPPPQSPPHASPGSNDAVIEVRPSQFSSGSENTSPTESPSGLDGPDKPLLPLSQSP